MARYDVHVQIIPASQQGTGKFMGFGQKRTVGVRGIQKLVDDFTIELLTPIGTDPLDLLRGTDLPNLLGSNVDVSDAQDILLLAVARTVTRFQDYQAGRAVPDDERLASASVTNFISLPEVPGFAAQIFIENVLDVGLTFLLPTLQVRT